MLEHEAFKGTRRIGTLDWQREAPLLDAQDEGRAAFVNSNKTLEAVNFNGKTDCKSAPFNVLYKCFSFCVIC